MKAFDTPILLALLEGDPAVRGLVKRLRGIELATTEANLLELALISAQGPGRARSARRDSLDRLRRKLTVLPIDAHAVDRASRHVGKKVGRLSPHLLGMLGALEASGCDELFTSDPVSELGDWKLKVSRVTERKM
jgi:predicted nucleic acid-binding protein